MAGEGEPRFSTCQSGGGRSRRRIYYFHFVLRQPLIVLHYYCLQLGANLFRLDSAVVSLMPFSLFCCKKKGGLLLSDWWAKKKKPKCCQKSIFLIISTEWTQTRRSQKMNIKTLMAPPVVFVGIICKNFIIRVVKIVIRGQMPFNSTLNKN